MERKLKRKSFSDVLEEAIKQRWGAKRKPSLVNMPLNTKKHKMQPIDFTKSQQDASCIGNDNLLSMSQPVVSEKRLPQFTKQSIKGWKPPLKIVHKNAIEVNAINSLKTPGNNTESLEEKFSQAGSVHFEAKNELEDSVIDPHVSNYNVHEEEDGLPNEANSSQELLDNSSLILKDNVTSGLQTAIQTTNIEQSNGCNLHDEKAEFSIMAISNKKILGNLSIILKDNENSGFQQDTQAAIEQNIENHHSYNVQEMNTELPNIAKSNKKPLENSSLILKGSVTSAIQHATQMTNVEQNIGYSCLPKSNDSFIQIATSGGIQNYMLSNEVSEIQQSKGNMENEVIINTLTASVNDQSAKIVESISDSEDIFSSHVRNTEVDMENVDVISLSQQSTQLFSLDTLNNNVIQVENSVAEEEVEVLLDNSENQLGSAKVIILPKNSSPANATNEDANTCSITCQAEYISNKGIGLEDEISVEKKAQDSLSNSNKIKELHEEDLSKCKAFSAIISISEIVESHQHCNDLEKNEVECINETPNSFSYKTNCTDVKCQINSDNSSFKQSDGENNHKTVSSTNVFHEITNNTEYENGCWNKINSNFQRSPSSKPYEQINQNVEDVDNSFNECSEIKAFEFDSKEFNNMLELKYKNVFHFENNFEQTLDKHHSVMLDNEEKSPQENINTTPEQDMQVKVPTNSHPCIQKGEVIGDLKGSEEHDDISSVAKLRKDENESYNDDSAIKSALSESIFVPENISEPMSELMGQRNIQTYNEKISEISELHSNHSIPVLPVERANKQSCLSVTRDTEVHDAKMLNNDNSIHIMGKDKSNTAADGLLMERENDTFQPNVMVEMASSEEKNSLECQKHTDKHENSCMVFKENNYINKDNNDLFLEMENLNTSDKKAVTENISAEKEFIGCSINAQLKSVKMKNRNNITFQPKTIDIEIPCVLDEQKFHMTDYKSNDENSLKHSDSTQIKNSLDEVESSNSSTTKARPEDVIYPAYYTDSIKKEKPPNIDLTSHTVISDAWHKNDSQALKNHTKEQYTQYSPKNKAEKEVVYLTLPTNKELELNTFKNPKQLEIKCTNMRSPFNATSDHSVAANQNDFPEMEDDLGLTASQILRIEDECQQNMFMPDILPIQWAQKVKESKRKIQGVIQEISKLNAMLKKVRDEVWQPASNENMGEGSTVAKEFGSTSKTTSRNWNRNLTLKSGKTMQRK